MKDNEEKDNEKNRKDDDTEEGFYTAIICVDYEKTNFSYNDPANIFVDGENIGRVTAGNKGEFIVILKGEKHKIWAESDTLIRNNNSKKQKFTISSEETVSFSLKDGSFKGLTIKQK